MSTQDYGMAEGRLIINGEAVGEVVGSNVMLSFWGGVNPLTGEVIDRHHPLSGQHIDGKILAVPSSRGSNSGSGAMLEMLLGGTSPTGLIFEREETIVPVGILVASEVYGLSIPVVQLASADFKAVCAASHARINGASVKYWSTSQSTAEVKRTDSVSPSVSRTIEEELVLPPSFKLTSYDQHLLCGSQGRAAQAAIRVILRLALLDGVSELIDITSAHLDGPTYTGPGCVQFALKMNEWNALVRIPSTLNSTGVDMQRWQVQGVNANYANPASELALAYVKMGAQPTYTCAPYLLQTTPSKGDCVIWSESNASIYANSVLGARTLKCPDHLDLCIALTGRAANAGMYVPSNRRAQMEMKVPAVIDWDDSFFPLLGYVVGGLAVNRIPIITGLEGQKITTDDLKVFGAAFATTSNAPMYHMSGITPEATNDQDLQAHLSAVKTKIQISYDDLAIGCREMDSGTNTKIDLISFGNPHFSYTEFAALARACEGRVKDSEVSMIITCGRDVYAEAYRAGYVPAVEAFGAQTITDTCWCYIDEPLIPLAAKTLMTNSGKYAHYGVGLTGRQIRFGSVAQCVDAACTGYAPKVLPSWLMELSLS